MLRKESIGGAKYFVTFIDDHTRWREVRFIKKKSDVFEAFRSYKLLLENRFDKSIKCVQSDNGIEYCNIEFDDFLNRNGIKRRLIVAHTLEENGVAERKNRILVHSGSTHIGEKGNEL